MKIALITTTINNPTVLKLYRQYADTLSSSDVSMIVAGDKKSPHADIVRTMQEVNGVYLHPDDQTEWESSEVIGWNSIQRRNIAILEAIRSGADAIVTVDDDNIPLESNYFGKIAHLLSRDQYVYQIGSPARGWYNAANMLIPPVYHRGYPYHVRSEHDMSITQELKWQSIGVVAGFWIGDPDIDAIERIYMQPDVQGVVGLGMEGFTLAPQTWCPFNSQNTAYQWFLAPLMMCWPGVGRFDDIWASYLARSIMDHSQYRVHYGQPIVKQERNEHDLYTDLEKEIFGYRHTRELCEALRTVTVHPDYEDGWTSSLGRAYDVVKELSFIPTQTKESFDAWIADVNLAMKERT